MEDHRHAEDGTVIIAEPIEALPEVAAAEATETVADASVQIAEIEAERDIAVAKTDIKRAEIHASEELAELRGRVNALAATVEALTPPEPEPMPTPPAPVVIEDEVPENPPPPAEAENKPVVGKPKSKSFWF